VPPWPAAQPQQAPWPAGSVSHRQARQSLSWPAWGLIGAGCFLVAGIVLSASAGGKTHGLGVTAGAVLWLVAFAAIAVCLSVAGWRWAARRRASARPSSR